MTNSPFQMRLPAVVSSTYHPRCSRSTPAGSDTAHRTSGTIRPRNTAARPRFANQASAASTSEIRTIGSRTTSARARARPRRAPSPYTISDPTTEPSVVQNSASARLNTPRLAEYPASGSTSSLGIGGNTFSTATTSAAPGPPSADITATAHSPSTSSTRFPHDGSSARHRRYEPPIPDASR